MQPEARHLAGVSSNGVRTDGAVPPRRASLGHLRRAESVATQLHLQQRRVANEHALQVARARLANAVEREVERRELRTPVEHAVGKTHGTSVANFVAVNCAATRRTDVSVAQARQMQVRRLRRKQRTVKRLEVDQRAFEQQTVHQRLNAGPSDSVARNLKQAREY